RSSPSMRPDPLRMRLELPPSVALEFALRKPHVPRPGKPVGVFPGLARPGARLADERAVVHPPETLRTIRVAGRAAEKVRPDEESLCVVPVRTEDALVADLGVEDRLGRLARNVLGERLQ